MSKRKGGQSDGHLECSHCGESFTPGFVEAMWTNAEGAICYYCLDCINNISEDGYDFLQKILNILKDRFTKEDCSVMLKILIKHPAITGEIPGILKLILQSKEKV